MVYQTDTVVRDVRVALGENRSGERLILDGDPDTLSLDAVIRSKIEEAVRRVGLSAPAPLLEEGHLFGDSVYWRGDGSGAGWTLLPDDFMRLIAFRMSDWERTCYEAISAGDPRYALQSSRFRGVRGSVQQPVCAIVNRSEGKALEFYSSPGDDASVQLATYLPYPGTDRDGGIDISERGYTAVVYTAASLVLTAYGEDARAEQYSSLAKSILEQ